MIFSNCDIMIPREGDVSRWSVVACDQYTSQPEYWQRVEQQVGDAPSTLHMIVPELYLEQEGVQARIAKVHRTMQQYLQQGILRTLPDSMILTQRTQKDGRVRCGIVLAVDLECYDYRPGSIGAIRATEGTVLERIPPRVQVRKGAVLEMPHIMLLMDDREHVVIPPLLRQKKAREKLYDADLMEQGGHVCGWLLDEADQQHVTEAVMQLTGADRSILFAVGDGNHSLAAAKRCYELEQERIGIEAAKNSPARWALAEVVNLHEDALDFEAIHRVVFDCEVDKLVHHLQRVCGEKGGPCVQVIWGNQQQEISLPKDCLAVDVMQQVLDEYLQNRPGKVDYIHGEDVVRQLSSQPGCVGILLPAMKKEDLFPTVLKQGALPRKTFSMGHAWDKRYYLECRKL